MTAGKHNKRHLTYLGSDLFYPNGCGKGRVLFTGPDGICDHRVRVQGPSQCVGIGRISPEGTSELSYLWRAAIKTNYPPSRSRRVGEVGWNVRSYNDPLLLKSNMQIRRGEFRQLAEDRHTHLYQNPWTPHPDDDKYDRYGREWL